MAKFYGVVGVSIVLGGVVSLVLNSSVFATPYVADVLPQRFQTTPTPAPQAIPALFTTGAVLIRRTQAALPSPDAVAEQNRLQTYAEQIATQKAAEAKQSALEELSRFKDSLTATESRLTAVAQSSAAQASAALVAGTTAQSAQMSALQSQMNSLQTMQSASAQAQQLALAGLQAYTQTQLATITAETSRTITQLAEQTQQSSAKMRFQTAQQLARIQSQAATNAQLLSMATAERIGQAVLAYQQQTDQRILTPQQVAAIANQSVQDAAPQVRAIALQSLKDSQDYLRTLTREAVQESDPAMAQALANAARNVIIKDDQVVFAIRKAVNEALNQPEPLLTSASPRTELGPDHGLAATFVSDTTIDASGLGVSAILGALEPAAGGAATSRTTAQLPLIKNPYASLTKARQRSDWMDLRQYRVAVHTDNLTLPAMLDNILKQATPYTGPWQVRWKLTNENQDLLKETFSLDAETTFEEFINYLAQYIMNDRGVKLGFALFDQERLIVVSD